MKNNEIFPRKVKDNTNTIITIYGVFADDKKFYIYSEGDLIGIVLRDNCREIQPNENMTEFDILRWWNEQINECNSPACKVDGEIHVTLPSFRYLRQGVIANKIRFVEDFNENTEDKDFIILTKDVE